MQIDELDPVVLVAVADDGIVRPGCVRKGEVVHAESDRRELRGELLVGGQQRRQPVADEGGVTLGRGRARCLELGRAAAHAVGDRILLADVEAVRACLVHRLQ